MKKRYGFRQDSQGTTPRSLRRDMGQSGRFRESEPYKNPGGSNKRQGFGSGMNGMTARIGSTFEAWVKLFLEERGLPGLAVAMTESGRDVYARGFGWSDREGGLPVTEDTLFGIGSITKSFTAAALMQLCEEGRMEIDAPVSRYVPELGEVFGERAEATTALHMLTHSTGMPPLPYLSVAMRHSLFADPDAQDDLQALDAALGVRRVNTPVELAELLGRVSFPWLGAPGEVFSYSNDSYGLLGLLVERVSGLPYETYVRRRLLEPAGLRRSAFTPDEASRMGNCATLYRRRPVVKKADPDRPPGREGELGEAVPSPVWHEAPAMTAAGFLKMSARDLARAFNLYVSGGWVNGVRLLSEESTERMCQARVRITPTLGYGLGLNRSTDRGLTLIQHGGGLKGVSAFAVAIPELDMTIAVLIHLGDEPASRVGMALLNTVLGLDPDASAPLPETGPLPAAAHALQGTYFDGESLSDVRFSWTQQGELLLMGPEGESPETVRWVGDGDFLAGEGRQVSWIRPVREGDHVTAVRVGMRTYPRRKRWEEAGFPLPVPERRKGQGS